MDRINLASLVLALLACLPIELSAQSQTDAAKPGTATVSGRVNSRGKSFRNITVIMQPEQAAPPENQSSILRAQADQTDRVISRSISLGNGTVIRDEHPAPPQDQGSILRVQAEQNGSFKITGISAGRYRIAASASMFVTSIDTSFDQQGTVLNIGEGENIENLDLEIKRGGVITGRITYSNNRPLVEERVQLMRLDQIGKPQPFRYDLLMGGTDDRGIYRIYGLPEGRYLVSIGVPQAEGKIRVGWGISGLPQTFHPDVTELSQAKIIEVVDGSETADVDIAVAEAHKIYNIYGRVVSAEDGQPVMGVELAFGSMEQDGQRVNRWRPQGVRSNSKGEFHLQDVLPGKHGIFAHPDQVNGVISEIVVCEVRDSDLQGVEVRVRQGSLISGQVVIEGTSDPAVLANITQIQLSFFTRSAVLSSPIRNNVRVNPEGGFRVRALQPGRVDIQVGNALHGFSILRIEREGTPVLPQEGLEIAPGENISNLRVVVGYNQGGGK
jgi:hypothetical protein